jgi:chromosome segregation ATPase
MSYKNASVSLEPGLNLIIGPNGAGKSSILLGISVVLGQTYTERAKRLSDLIRWGEEEARVSLVLDNAGLKGVKPFPHARGDSVTLTRVLKKSGDYNYLLNNKPVSKNDVLEGLSNLGLNPDNMLVIMHQLMVGRFGSVTPTEKLLMLEDAVGFAAYRREVLDSSERLQKLTTEHQAMASVLEGTRETYEHWRREHEKWESKKKLELQLQDLQRELVWRKIIRKEASQKRLDDRVARVREDLADAKTEHEISDKKSKEASLRLLQLNADLEKFRTEQLSLEHQRGFKEATNKWIEKTGELLKLTNKLTGDKNGGGESGTSNADLKRAIGELDVEARRLSQSSPLEAEHSGSLRNKIVDLTGQLSKDMDLLVESRVKTEVNKFKIAAMDEQMHELETQLRLGLEELEPLQVQASQLGPRFDTPREFQTISVDIATVEDRLKPLAHLSEDVEKLYRNYAGLYEDLKKKAEIVEQNRGEVLHDLRERLEKWRKIMEKLFEELSTRYDSLLAEVGAKGRIVLKPAREIEKSGLELYAGFKGNEPVSLDSLAPSGGERTVAIIAFLLSLQQYVESPFRAIDEFDVHMDPKNRETVTKLIYAAATSSDPSEYIAITPGEVALPEGQDVHVVVVQNVEGSSIVKELK